eukprot:18098-Heterococcus_DN1.PRE.1
MQGSIRTHTHTGNDAVSLLAVTQKHRLSVLNFKGTFSKGCVSRVAHDCILPTLCLQMAGRDIVAEAEGLYAKCREHLVTDRLQRAFVHLHPEHASQFSSLKREYLRFVVLKLLEKDTAADAKLSPSLAVDKMWHSHVLVCWTALRQSSSAMLQPTKIWPAATAAAAAAAAAAPVTPTASTAPELAAAGGDAEAGSSRKRSAAIALQDDDAVESCSDSASGSALKRAAQGAVAHITISVSAGRGEEVLFKTKTSTKMLKIFKAFAAQVNKDCADLKFFGPDMRQIDPNWTVQYVGLTEGDEFDVLYPQQGC